MYYGLQYNGNMQKHLDFKPIQRKKKLPLEQQEKVAIKNDGFQPSALLPFFLIFSLSAVSYPHYLTLFLAILVFFFLKKQKVQRTEPLLPYYLLLFVASLFVSGYLFHSLFPSIPLPVFTGFLFLGFLLPVVRKSFPLPAIFFIGIGILYLLSLLAAPLHLTETSFSFNPLFALALLGSLAPVLPNNHKKSPYPLIFAVVAFSLLVSQGSPFHSLLGDLDHLIPTLILLVIALHAAFQYHFAIQQLPSLKKAKKRLVFWVIVFILLAIISCTQITLLQVIATIGALSAVLLVPLFLPIPSMFPYFLSRNPNR